MRTVGCGPGADAFELGGRVPFGPWIPIDPEEAQIGAFPFLEFTMPTILFTSAGFSTAVLALVLATAQPPQAPKPPAAAGLKSVSARVVAPAAKPRAATAIPMETPVVDDGDRFRYDSCGCSGG